MNKSFVSEEEVIEFNRINELHKLHMVQAIPTLKDYVSNLKFIMNQSPGVFIKQYHIDNAKQQLEELKKEFPEIE